ncbi:MAG: cyclic nucleotide-binding domain-containing protein [Pseudomonadota bacterium]
MTQTGGLSAYRIGLLQSMALFGAVDPSALEFLLQHTEELELEAGDTVFHEQDAGTQMYVLESGRVAVLKSWQGIERQLAVLGPGDCFGEMALMDFQRRSATVRATESCLALVLGTDALLELYEHDVEQFTLIQMNMGREVSRRLRDADDRIFRATFGDRLDDRAGSTFFT